MHKNARYLFGAMGIWHSWGSDVARGKKVEGVGCCISLIISIGLAGASA